MLFTPGLGTGWGFRREAKNISGGFMPLRVTLPHPIMPLQSTGRIKADSLPGQTPRSHS